MPPIPQREIWDIVIHCSDSPNGRPDTIRDIDSWHRKRGFFRAEAFRIKKQFNPGLTSVGYNFVITVDGQVHSGRHVDEIPAQAAGHNSKGVGICMVGKDKFTPAQWTSLKQLVTQLLADIVASDHKTLPRIIGHCDYPDSHKTCPNFSALEWLQRGMVAVEAHVLREVN